jgi:hypothetical protein
MDYPLIGISGAARSGKDTLCRALINILNSKGYKAKRKSIAGDLIKKDLNSIVRKKIGIDLNTENNKLKKIIRPLLIEYGKLMRNQTNGRYFIDKFKTEKNIITIIPDIRYAEYEKDELFWLKKQKNSFLVFIKHDLVNDANDTEKKNNKVIKKYADFNLKWSTLKEENPIDKLKIDNIAEKIANLYLKTYHLPIGHVDALK